MNIIEELALTALNVCAQALITLPIDNVKLVQQLSAEKELNLLQAAQEIYDQTGFYGFYAGLYTRVWTTIPDEISAKVVGYADVRSRLKSMLSITEESGVTKKVVSGTVAAIPNVILTYPTSMLKDNELLPMLGKEELSSEDVARISLGFPALTTSILQIFVDRTVYFTTQDMASKSGWDKATVKIITKLIAGYIVYPLDTIRRTQHLAALGALEADAKVDTMLDAYNYIVEKNGVLGLWKGAQAEILKNFVADMAKDAVPDISTIYKSLMHSSA